MDLKEKKQIIKNLDEIKDKIENDKIDAIVMAYKEGKRAGTGISGDEITIFGLTSELMSDIAASKQEKHRREQYKNLIGMFADNKED